MMDFNLNKTENFILLDDSQAEKTMLFCHPIKKLVAFNREEFLNSLTEINELRKKYYVVGYIRYEAHKLFNEDIKFNKPALYFEIFEKPQIVNLQKGSYTPYTTIKPDVQYTNYKDTIKEIKNEIEQGNTYQVNYTYNNEFKAFCSDETLYTYLREQQKTQYGAFIKNDYEKIMSFSPELFFEIKNSTITTKPMKGTIKKGNDPLKNAELKAFLKTDAKNRAENIMIVDLLRNDISRISNRVEVKSLFNIESYQTLYQMTSTVTGELSSWDVTTLFEALFPCGSITGAPKTNTIKIIESLEQRPREIYCGAIGFLSPEKTVFSVPIRILQSQEKNWNYQVGSGIVWDSSAEEEWQETKLKTSFLEGKTDFELIETMLIKNSKVVYLNEHINRLQQSAKFFNFEKFNIPEMPKEDGILRLKLNKKGEIHYEHKQLSQLSNKIKLATQQIDSKNIFLQHKTSYRPWYSIDTEGYFDTIFFNERKELTEGTRSNVFIKKNGLLYTPPIECGVLGGILRQKLIDERKCKEKILYKKDLESADAIYCGNSVRGLVKVRL